MDAAVSLAPTYSSWSAKCKATSHALIGLVRRAWQKRHEQLRAIDLRTTPPLVILSTAVMPNRHEHGTAMSARAERRIQARMLRISTETGWGTRNEGHSLPFTCGEKCGTGDEADPGPTPTHPFRWIDSRGPTSLLHPAFGSSGIRYLLLVVNV